MSVYMGHYIWSLRLDTSPQKPRMTCEGEVLIALSDHIGKSMGPC
jgi:hypothetical protein